jgi:hypothetical protein
MQEPLSITNPHIGEARASQFESLSESFCWRVAGHKGVPLRANGADFEHGIPDCSCCFDMDDNLGHKPGKRPALGCSKELTGVSVRRQVARQRRCIFSPSGVPDSYCLSHLPGRLRAAFSFRYVGVSSHDASVRRTKPWCASDLRLFRDKTPLRRSPAQGMRKRIRARRHSTPQSLPRRQRTEPQFGLASGDVPQP